MVDPAGCMERQFFEQRLFRLEARARALTTVPSVQKADQERENINKELSFLQQTLVQGRVSGVTKEEDLRVLRDQVEKLQNDLQGLTTPATGKQRILEVQNQIFAFQDRALDDIAAQLSRVNQLSTGIHDEVDLHAGLLDDLETGMARGNESVAQAASHAREVNVSQSGTCKLWLAVITLFIVLVLLLSL